MNRIFQSLIVSFVFVLFAGQSATAQVGQPPALPDNPAPSLRLRGVDGRNYDLNEMRGSVVLVSFGATWCVPCSAELIALEALKDEYANRPVRFFWVSTDQADTSNSVIRQYARERGLSFPILRDPEQSAFRQFSTRQRIPMVVFFDREGRYVAPTHFGMSTPDAYSRLMRRRIDALLQPTIEAGSVGTTPRN
jgi:peroxiredoxin